MKSLLYLLLAAVVLTMAAPTVSAQSLAEAKQSMKERFEEVMDLKKAKLVGEGNRGYLVPRGDLNSSQRSLVDAENSDRKVFFTGLAKEGGIDVVAAGKYFAKQNIKRQPPGIWVQDGAGDWYLTE